MTVVEYLHMLIDRGEWLSITPQNQRVFLAILARSRGEKQVIDWRNFSEFTGLQELEVKEALEALIAHGLLVKTKGKIKIAADSLDHESISIPKPPYEKTGAEFQEALRNLIAGQWEGILGGSLVVYLLQLWFDYIYQLDSKNTDLAEKLLSDAAIFEGFQELELLAYKDNSIPLYLMNPTDWSEVIRNNKKPPRENTVSVTEVETLFANLQE